MPGPEKTAPPGWLGQSLVDVPVEDGWLSPSEATAAAALRFQKRRASFRLSRWTAKRAISLWLGRPDDPSRFPAIDVRRAPDGAPDPRLDGAPAPVSLSLSDREGVAAALVGPLGLALGGDVERVERRSAAFLADYFTAAEQALVRRAGPEERDLFVTLVWSAKESALKALRTGLRRDTRSVVVAVPEAPEAEGWRPLTVTAVEGTTFPGWWRRGTGFVMTAVAGRALPPPRLLLPAGLPDPWGPTPSPP